jgi:transposase InsO family protein
MKVVPENIIQEILKKYSEGKTPTELSREYGFAKSSIYRWLNSRTQREVQAITHLSLREFQLMQVELERLRNDSMVFYRCKCSRSSPITEKLAEIDRLKGEFSIHSLCRILAVNRSTFYHHQNRSPQKTQIEIGDEFFSPKIKAIFEESKERFGARKIRVKLMAEGHTISMKRIHRLMKEMELVCKQSRLRYWSTTARKCKYYPNRLQQEFKQTAPNLVWVSDITYIRVKNDFHYICIVIDIFSRRVLSHRISEAIDEKLAREAFDAAFEFRNKPTELMFHSDQGVQYTAFSFRKHLRTLGVKQSFSNPGMPLDNAVAESFIACMKREELSHNLYESREQLEQDVSEYVDFYNRMRPYQKLGSRTPEQIENEYFP